VNALRRNRDDDDQYLDILAFDLKANGVDLTGKPPLSPDNLAGYALHP
jgi:hypothetical protein